MTPHPTATAATLAFRLTLLALVALAFVLDLAPVPSVWAALLHAAVALACLHRRDRLALVGLGGLSMALLLLAGALDPQTPLLTSLGAQRGSTLGTLALIILPGTHLLRRWERQQRQLTELAHTDPLTGLANRRQLDRQLARACQLAHRYGDPLAVLMLDLDHFKRLNDRLGHAAGDQLLTRFATLLQQQVRGSDLPARYGGEEFVVLCPHTDEMGALTLAERVREQWQHLTADLPSAQTVSIGVAALEPGATPEQLLDTADQALYRAKAQGRNRSLLPLRRPSAARTTAMILPTAAPASALRSH
ncbi:GGDEF domain-containing protein [Ferrimonas balearica]|uniref:GGDEF domain-containing protein n=1 Tax=Ferrimonas balearica TaxID=44012 RepID=UPI001C9A234A|nr:GGDEF domain-containing protein [Ferrimonas balearica]MBY5993350.1 GGDEF domain-containing protein [Ferrimonas balearica]